MSRWVGGTSAEQIAAASQAALPTTPADALHRLTLARLQKFIDWLKIPTVDAKGFLSETGWPAAIGPRAGEAAQWAALQEQWYRLADAAGLDAAVWATGSIWGSTYQLSPYIALGGVGKPVTATLPQANIIEAHPSRNGYLRGVNVSGLESGIGNNQGGGTGDTFSNTNRGTYGTTYIAEDPATFGYLAARGIKLVRVLFRWERVQPTLGAALDTTELARLTSVVTAARKAGLFVTISPHNFAAYWIGSGGTGTRTAISLPESTTQTAVTAAHFYDLWTRLSTAFKDDPGVFYHLMNEPGVMSTLTNPFTITDTFGDFAAGTDGWVADGGNATLSRVTTGQYEGSGALSVAKNWATENFSTVYVNPGRVFTSATKVRMRIKLPPGATSGSATISLQTDGFTTTVTGTAVALNASTYTLVEYAPGTTVMAKNIDKLSVLIVANGVASSTQAALIDDGRAGYTTTGTVAAAQAWEQLAQGAVQAIRGNGDNKRIDVPLYDSSNVDRCLSNHPTGPWVNDSAKNITYAAHHYPDTFMSGQFSASYSSELATAVGLGA